MWIYDINQFVYVIFLNFLVDVVILVALNLTRDKHTTWTNCELGSSWMATFQKSQCGSVFFDSTWCEANYFLLCWIRWENVWRYSAIVLISKNQLIVLCKPQNVNLVIILELVITKGVTEHTKNQIFIKN